MTKPSALTDLLDVQKLRGYAARMTMAAVSFLLVVAVGSAIKGSWVAFGFSLASAVILFSQLPRVAGGEADFSAPRSLSTETDERRQP